MKKVKIVWDVLSVEMLVPSSTSKVLPSVMGMGRLALRVSASTVPCTEVTAVTSSSIALRRYQRMLRGTRMINEQNMANAISSTVQATCCGLSLIGGHTSLLYAMSGVDYTIGSAVDKT